MLALKLALSFFFQPVRCVFMFFFLCVFFFCFCEVFPTRRMISAEQSASHDDALPFLLGYNLFHHISAKAATCIQACECAHPYTARPTVGQADRQKHSHAPPLTLRAVFSGWVMSHCSLLSLLQQAIGWSGWPHSATFTSPIWIWSHTFHFTFSLLQAVINLFNQSRFKLSSPEIHNGRQTQWAATSSYVNELWWFYRRCLRWVKCRLRIAGLRVVCISMVIIFKLVKLVLKLLIRAFSSCSNGVSDADSEIVLDQRFHWRRRLNSPASLLWRLWKWL